MQVWVTRDKDSEGLATVWDNDSDKISLNSNGLFVGASIIFCYEPDLFKDSFGFTPRKGSCKQYNLTLTEVKE